MSHKAPIKKASFDPVPAGAHVTRLYQIVHVGTVPSTYKGEARMTDQIRLTFELCELCNEKKEFREGEGEKPLSISTRFETYSMGKKANLRRLIDGMSGIRMHDDEAYNFDLDKLLGMECLLTVVHNEGSDGNIYANIQGASPLPKGMTAPELFNKPRFIDVNEITEEELAELPQFLQDKMKSSEEWQSCSEGPKTGPVDRVDGSVYSGECACLCGTLAKAQGLDSGQGLPFADPNSLAERFFLAIHKGDTPDKNPAARLALEWVDEFLALTA